MDLCSHLYRYQKSSMKLLTTLFPGSSSDLSLTAQELSGRINKSQDIDGLHLTHCRGDYLQYFSMIVSLQDIEKSSEETGNLPSKEEKYPFNTLDHKNPIIAQCTKILQYQNAEGQEQEWNSKTILALYSISDLGVKKNKRKK